MDLQKHFSKWCVWRLGTPRVGSKKPSKQPINPNTGRGGRSNDPETFGTYEQAQQAMTRGKYAGLGVLMSSGAGVVCVDVDDCLAQDGKPNGVAAWALSNFKGYCEISQSGRGLHFFMRACKPAECATKVTHEGHSLEVYGERDTRFVCVTGRPFREVCGDVLEEQEALSHFAEHFGFLRPRVGTTVAPSPDSDDKPESEGPEHSDAEILGLLRRNNKRGKITRLLDGNLKDCGGDHSAADLALASEIAYYTQDAKQVERVFNTSKLAARAKWRERADYRELTITKALDSCQNYYWDREGKSGGKAAEAVRAGRAERLIGGLDGIAMKADGTLRPTISNAIEILRRDHRLLGVLAYNEFAGAPEVLRPLQDVFGKGASQGAEFADHDITAIRAWLGREWGMELRRDDAWAAIIMWARSGLFNPVVSRLDDCAKQWDGTPRIDSWLQDYFRADTTGCLEYVQSIGRKWLIGAVARAKQPGCKMDNVLVLEGAQGAGKSRAARVLAEAVYRKGFVENLPALRNSKETALALRGAWIVELAELAAFQGRVESEHIKAFLTAQEDTGRMPWGLRYEQWQRTVAFVGTTNENEYLRDTTGGRRFWSVKVGSVNIEKLQRDAQQLWGEAVRAYDSGESWHLENAQALSQAAEQQHDRQVSDTWDDAIEPFAQKAAAEPNAHSERWEMAALFQDVLQGTEPLNNRRQAEQRRFAQALRRCGFSCKKTRGVMRWHLTDEKIRKVRADRGS